MIGNPVIVQDADPSSRDTRQLNLLGFVRLVFVCAVLLKLSQKLRNCVRSPLNFAKVVLSSPDFDGCHAETVELGCE